jgi:rhamnan synthesis protein F
MDAKKRAFVIAHFHPKGAIAIGLRNLIAALLAYSENVVFVSTNAAPHETGTLPRPVKVITRPNVGYDFYSYKVGIEALGDVSGLDQLVILNSSFVCVDPAKLCANFLSPPARGVDLLGLSASREIELHLQSYFVSFENAAVIGSAAFAEWWRAMQPVSDRSRVISQYEIGMSKYFVERGFRLGAAFAPSPQHKLLALCRAMEFSGRFPDIGPDGTVVLDTAAADSLNPTHFLWDRILEEFGILKLELLKTNPFRLDLRALTAAYQASADLRRVLDDALSEA